MLKTLTTFVFILLSITAFCQSNYKEIKPGDDEALVFIVRPSKLGFLVGFTITCDNTIVGVTKGKKYIYTIVKPGSHKIMATGGEKDADIEINVEAGKTYYIEQKIKMGLILARTKLEIVEENKGTAFLDKCQPAKAR